MSKVNRVPVQLTIITICFNAEAYIEETFKSIASQVKQPTEYIVIDGQSTDGTISLIKKYQHIITHWFSEKDHGIADAMNKGIVRSTGDYILFLHADDYLYSPDVIAKAYQAMQQREDIYAFDILYDCKGNKLRRTSRQLGFWTNFKTGVNHQGIFCHRRVFDDIGLFNQALTIAMDYEFFLRVYRKGYHLTLVPEILSVMRDTGISASTDKKIIARRFQEEQQIHFKLCPNLKLYLLYRVYWVLYPLYRERWALGEKT